MEVQQQLRQKNHQQRAHEIFQGYEGTRRILFSSTFRLRHEANAAVREARRQSLPFFHGNAKKRRRLGIGRVLRGRRILYGIFSRIGITTRIRQTQTSNTYRKKGIVFSSPVASEREPSSLIIMIRERWLVVVVATTGISILSVLLLLFSCSILPKRRCCVRPASPSNNEKGCVNRWTLAAGYSFRYSHSHRKDIPKDSAAVLVRRG